MWSVTTFRTTNGARGWPKRLTATATACNIYSVFEAVLSKTLFDNLIKAISSIIAPSEDWVTIYPLCAACARKRLNLARGADGGVPGEEMVFVV